MTYVQKCPVCTETRDKLTELSRDLANDTCMDLTVSLACQQCGGTGEIHTAEAEEFAARISRPLEDRIERLEKIVWDVAQATCQKAGLRDPSIPF